MNNEKMNQIVDEVYENYLDGGEVKWLKQMEVNTPIGKMNIPIPYPKEEFIHKCKTDSEFSERWGLKIEERELSLEERSKIWNETHNPVGNIYTHNQYDENDMPTKLITITYKNKTIESYE